MKKIMGERDAGPILQPLEKKENKIMGLSSEGWIVNGSNWRRQLNHPRKGSKLRLEK